MLFSLTNILGLSGLVIIFITAGLVQDGMEWLPGVFLILVILAVRNIALEVTSRKETLLSVFAFIIVLITFLLLIN